MHLLSQLFYFFICIVLNIHLSHTRMYILIAPVFFGFFFLNELLAAECDVLMDLQ